MNLGERCVPTMDDSRYDASWYVPDEGLVRATIDASGCVGEVVPRSAAELLHVTSCDRCQTMMEIAAVAEGWGATQYVPADALVSEVLARSSARHFRFPFEVQRTTGATGARNRSPAKVAATLLLALGLSPSVLAAAVFVHAAAFVVAGGWFAKSMSTPTSTSRAVGDWVSIRSGNDSRTESVRYFALPSPAASRQVAMAELSATVRQSIGVMNARLRISVADERQLTQTALTLGTFASATVRLESDSSQLALRTAEMVSHYLMDRGVAAKRVRIVVRPGLTNVRVALDATP
ncbi:MAG: hypothetical protein ABI625_09955 [bacterium]